MVVEIIVAGLIWELASAVFKRFFDAVLAVCQRIYRFLRNVIEGTIQYIRMGYYVVSYLYKRYSDGWYRQEVVPETGPQKISIEECPLSIRSALFNDDQVVVHKF